MKFGSSEHILVNGLQSFRQEQLKEIDEFLKVFGSAYKLLEEDKVQIPRRIQFALSNIRALRKFIENFSATFVYGEDKKITGFSLTWEDRYGWESSESNVKQLMVVLSVIDKHLADFEKSQIHTLGAKCTPPINVITNAVQAYETVVNLYAMRND